MRRIFSALIVGLMLVSCSFAYAGQGWESYVSDNATSAMASTVVSTSRIVPGTNDILGYSILSRDGNACDSFMALYDSTTGTSEAVAEVLAEAENVSTLQPTTLFFDYPMQLKYGLTIRQGANSRVIIYYTSNR